jgi:hypothetical protein
LEGGGVCQPVHCSWGAVVCCACELIILCCCLCR